MKIVPVLLLTSLLLAQTKPEAKPATKTLPVIGDKERVEFLMVQRDWITIQKQYEAAFNKEVPVVQFMALMERFNKICMAGGAQFDANKAVCAALPEPAKPTSTK